MTPESLHKILPKLFMTDICMLSGIAIYCHWSSCIEDEQTGHSMHSSTLITPYLKGSNISLLFRHYSSNPAVTVLYFRLSSAVCIFKREERSIFRHLMQLITLQTIYDK